VSIGLAWIAVWSVVAAVVASRYRRASGPGAQRLRWAVWGLGVGAALAGGALALHVLIGWTPPAWAVVAAASVPLALGLAASRSPLRDRVDVLIAGTLAAAAVAGVVVACFLLLAPALGRGLSNGEQDVLGLSLVGAAAAIVVYPWAHRRLARAASRALYGERRPPQEAIAAFGRQLSRAVPLDELLLQLAETLRRTLALAAAELWLASGGVLTRTVADPDRGPRSIALAGAEAPLLLRGGVAGNAWLEVWMPELLTGDGIAQVRVAPIAHAGELLGVIVAERLPGAEPFGDEHDRVLSELAHQVGLALHNVQLDSALQASLADLRRHAEELRASRARIVTAADAERRRVERDIHDGAQQHLVTLAVNLRLATLHAGAPPELVAALEELQDDVGAALEELRDLAHGIYPVLLANEGLASALQDVAERAAIPTVVAADGIGRYRPEVETAVYFCCLEALQNATKHAGPDATATIELAERSGALVFSVSDDGVGWEPQRLRRGAGLVNMADRLGAVGGTLRIEASPGLGARVSGVVSLGDDAE
jgi:signal transduction histidine kinase